MEFKKEYTITIKATLGSDFQLECFEEFLKCTLEAIKRYFNTSHENNKIKISLINK